MLYFNLFFFLQRNTLFEFYLVLFKLHFNFLFFLWKHSLFEFHLGLCILHFHFLFFLRRQSIFEVCLGLHVVLLKNSMLLCIQVLNVVRLSFRMILPLYCLGLCFQVSSECLLTSFAVFFKFPCNPQAGAITEDFHCTGMEGSLCSTATIWSETRRLLVLVSNLSFVKKQSFFVQRG